MLDKEKDLFDFLFSSSLNKDDIPTNETKGNIVKTVFSLIDKSLNKKEANIDDMSEVSDIENEIKKYYSARKLGDATEEIYQNVTNILLPTLISNINEAIDKKRLNKDRWETLLIHFFTMMSDYMKKIEENIK